MKLAATVSWHNRPSDDGDYSRDHEWTFPGGEVIPASAAVEYGGASTRVGPDEAVVAALSSCHMLTFIAIAEKSNLKVRSYIDRPEGALEENEEGRQAINRVVLRPKVIFETDVDYDELTRMHGAAHRNCFVANSLRTEVDIEPVVD